MLADFTMTVERWADTSTNSLAVLNSATWHLSSTTMQNSSPHTVIKRTVPLGLLGLFMMFIYIHLVVYLEGARRVTSLPLLIPLSIADSHSAHSNVSRVPKRSMQGGGTHTQVVADQSPAKLTSSTKVTGKNLR